MVYAQLGGYFDCEISTGRGGLRWAHLRKLKRGELKIRTGSAAAPSFELWESVLYMILA